MKKNVKNEEVVRSQSKMIGRSLSHLRRSLRQFSEGLQSRMLTLQERLLIEPLEGAAWVVSQRVRKVQTRVFNFIYVKISTLEDARHRKLDHQTALERFDGEGGAMLPTSTTERTQSGEAVKAAESPRTTPKRTKFAFEPGLQH